MRPDTQQAIPPFILHTLVVWAITVPDLPALAVGVPLATALVWFGPIWRRYELATPAPIQPDRDDRPVHSGRGTAQSGVDGVSEDEAGAGG